MDELTISAEIKRKWKILGKWALFFGILGLIVLSIGLVYGLITVLLFNRTHQMEMPVQYSLGWMSLGLFVIWLGLGVLVFFIHWYHIRFATSIRIAIEQDQQAQFEKAWRYLRNHFRLFGIAVIGYLALLLGSISVLSYFVPI